MVIPSDEEEIFSMVEGSDSNNPNKRLARGLLQKAVIILEKFYGDDYEYWHEMCLEAKTLIVQLIANKETTSPSDRENIVRKALAHCFKSYEA